MKRINLDEWRLEGDRIILLGATAHRASHVLRVRRGESVTGTDGRGRIYSFEVSAVFPDRVEGLARLVETGANESPLKITLAQAVPKGSRMDLVIQKATELGVTRIVPLISRRGVVRPVGEPGSRLARWERIAAEAVAQSRRAQAPRIDMPTSLEAFLGSPVAPLRLLLQPEAGAASLGSIPRPASPEVDLIVGPEGGLDAGEVTACRRAGYVPVSLGPRILRSETAGIAALAILQHLWGDVG